MILPVARGRMTKLILHIGGHRTGSTSIQAALSSSFDELLKNGILYPKAGLDTVAHHCYVNSLRKSGVPGFSEVAPLETLLADLKQEIAASGCHTVLISSEEFINSPEIPSSSLSQLLGLFSEVLVICVVRHQGPLLESGYKFQVLWEQTASGGSFEDFIDYNTRGAHLEYVHLPGYYGAAHPNLQFRFASFGDLARSGELVSRFCAMCDIDFLQARNIHTNESLGRKCTIALAMRNRGEIGTDLSRHAFIRAARTSLHDRGESLFDEQLFARIVERFRASNDTLAATAGFNLNDEARQFAQKHSLKGSAFTGEDQAALGKALAEARRHPVVLRLRDFARRIVSRLRRLRKQAFAS